jgi:hypothetical protein
MWSRSCLYFRTTWVHPQYLVDFLITVGIFKLFFIHSFKSCIHAQDVWCVMGTILWRKVSRSNLQHVKVWNDKFTIYLPTSCGFQRVFIFSLLFKPSRWKSIFIFQEIIAQLSNMVVISVKNSKICYNIYMSNLLNLLSIFHVAQSQLKIKRKYIFPFCHNTLL